MGRGKHRRLKKRYEKYDREKILYALPLIPLFFVLLLFPGYLIRLSGYTHFFSGLLSFVMSIGWLILDVVVLSLLLRKIIDHLTEKYNLRCVQCGKPLDRLPMLGRRATLHPDYRNDGEVPKRCPHCQIPIEEATRRSAKSNQTKSTAGATTDNL